MTLYVCDTDRATGDDAQDSPDRFCRELANDTVPRDADGCVRRDNYDSDWMVLEASSPEGAFAQWEQIAATQRYPHVEQELFAASYRAGALGFDDIDECWTPA